MLGAELIVGLTHQPGKEGISIEQSPTIKKLTQGDIAPQTLIVAAIITTLMRIMSGVIRACFMSIGMMTKEPKHERDISWKNQRKRPILMLQSVQRRGPFL